MIEFSQLYGFISRKVKIFEKAYESFTIIGSAKILEKFKPIDYDNVYVTADNDTIYYKEGYKPVVFHESDFFIFRFVDLIIGNVNVFRYLAAPEEGDNDGGEE